jgi:hypothetical protein
VYPTAVAMIAHTAVKPATSRPRMPNREMKCIGISNTPDLIVIFTITFALFQPKID